MVNKIIENTPGKGMAFKKSVSTMYDDAVFRKKRSMLTCMDTAEMDSVLEMINVDKGLIARNVTKAVATKAVAAGKHKVKAVVKPLREVYTANNKRVLSGKLVRKEGQPPVADKDVNRVYDAAGDTWQMYYSIFDRNSIDGKGMKIIQSVHYGIGYENAFWDGKQMVYGDGGEVFSSFTKDIDIIGHELSHGVVQYEANLTYLGQSGAINEHMADVFGMLVRQFTNKETAKKSNWLIGQNTFRQKGYALRSMKKPGKAYINHPILGTDPQPGHMDNYQNLAPNDDDGGVHINSGIPNRAFFLTAYNLGGNAWEKAGKIWYCALCDPTQLNADSQFVDLKAATIYCAEKLYGINSKEKIQVVNAWNEVGV